MLSIWNQWLLDAVIKKKFIPAQAFLFILVLCLGLYSSYSVYKINTLSNKIYVENFTNLEMMSTLVKKMYVCRVLGRDILFQTDSALSAAMYKDYIDAFDELDQSMNAFAKRLKGKKLEEFSVIIQEKDKYKESMILSADIHMQGGHFEEALHALQVVTPIANTFFSSIEKYHQDEIKSVNLILQENKSTTQRLVFLVLFFSFFVLFAVHTVISYSTNFFSHHLIDLSSVLSKISETGNMKLEIPSKFFTKDEFGQIVSVVEKLKNVLQESSFKDNLTEGYNATAYYFELYDYFESTENLKNEKKFTLVIFDMNNLKTINDTLGHVTGDKAIVLAYSILNECFSPYGKVFRVGGDEFVAILQILDKEQIERAITCMNDKIMNANKDNIFKIGMASGYGIFEGNTKEQFTAFYEEVDRKMYQNKSYIKMKNTSFNDEKMIA